MQPVEQGNAGAAARALWLAKAVQQVEPPGHVN